LTILPVQSVFFFTIHAIFEHAAALLILFSCVKILACFLLYKTAYREGTLIRSLRTQQNRKDRKMTSTSSIEASKRICATCQYWQGEREVKFITAQYVRVNYHTGQAYCAAFKQNKGSGFYCNRYKRWVQLP